MNIWKSQQRLIEVGRTLFGLVETNIIKHMAYARPMITFVSKNYKTPDLVGVEIGVSSGVGALFILNTLPIKRLFLIDPYVVYQDECSDQSDVDEALRVAKKRVAKFGDKIEFIRKRSEDAAEDVPGELDFVYIDGNHGYEFVKRDIELYYPKVKVGGVLGGDNFESLFPSVARAAIEFAHKHRLKIYGARSRASYEWWVIKK